MENVSVIEVEIKAIRMGIDYYKILCRSWEAPWLISPDVGYINGLMMKIKVEVQEGNNSIT
ncbi:hypothetical protein H5410_061925 [Solanum commersonii]|uniref:Uncharacterized protein n=1 Tax=Solanum commersonii TaxID=4109 RepID=A0A9J5WA07_SOLCO|nr:hypothetical protein H5410_061925 [Solanum commersonii]